MIAQALLTREDTDSMRWAFEHLELMIGDAGLQPTTILTDADRAAAEALKIVFPLINHFRCIWHLMQNLVKQCKGAIRGPGAWERFVRRFRRAAWARTLAHFEKHWRRLINVSYDRQPARHATTGTSIPPEPTNHLLL